jgi:hypothetical protein
MIDIFEIGTIKRLPLETSYTNVVAIVHALLLRCPAGTELIIDGTGVGKPVADIFKWHGVTPWCVTATAGIEQTIDAANRTANVPKLVLISRIQSLLFEGRLKVHEQIEDAAAFLAELRDFRVEYSASGHMTYNAKAGRHDDMVSAAAVAAWRLSDGAVGWGPPSAELAAMVLGLGGSHPGPAPWAIGLDLGKVHDPTAIVVMRRVSVDRPELPHRDTEPMVVVPEIPRNKTDELLRREAIGERETPEHPDVGYDSEVEHVNGPKIKSQCARGSLEWQRQQEHANA